MVTKTENVQCSRHQCAKGLCGLNLTTPKYRVGLHLMILRCDSRPNLNLFFTGLAIQNEERNAGEIKKLFLIFLSVYSNNLDRLNANGNIFFLLYNLIAVHLSRVLKCFYKYSMCTVQWKKIYNFVQVCISGILIWKTRSSWKCGMLLKIKTIAVIVITTRFLYYFFFRNDLFMNL